MTQTSNVQVTIDMTIAKAVVLTADDNAVTKFVTFMGKVINHSDEKLIERDCKRFVRQHLADGETLIKVSGFQSITLTADADLATVLKVADRFTHTNATASGKDVDVDKALAELKAVAETETETETESQSQTETETETVTE